MMVEKPIELSKINTQQVSLSQNTEEEERRKGLKVVRDT
jgi:hypothetical protein